MDIIWLTAAAILIHRLVNRLFGRGSVVLSLASFLSGWCCGMFMHAAASLVQFGLMLAGLPTEGSGGAGVDTWASVCGVAFGVLLARHLARSKSAKADRAPNHA